MCGNGGQDLVLGTITCSPTSLFGPAAVYGFAATPALSELFTLGNAGQPGGNTNSWLIPNLDAAAEFTGLYTRPLRIDAGNNRSVTEEVTGGYFQFDVRGRLLGQTPRPRRAKGRRPSPCPAAGRSNASSCSAPA